VTLSIRPTPVRKDTGDRPGEARVRAILDLALTDMTGVTTADQVALAERLVGIRGELEAAFRRGYARGPKPPTGETPIQRDAIRHSPMPFQFTEQQLQLFQYSFDLINDQSVSYAQQKAGELIVEIVLEQLGLIRSDIVDAVSGNKTPQQAARSIRNVIGLHTRWATAVSRYEERQYIQLVKDGKAPEIARRTAAQRAARYAKTLTAKRAKVIARTEIMDAENAGHMQAVINGANAGYVHLKTQIEWITAEDELTCPVCRPMNGKIITLGEMFELKGRAGNRAHPPAHPNCRCTFNELPPDYADDPWWNDLKPNATTPSDHWKPTAPGATTGGARLIRQLAKSGHLIATIATETTMSPEKYTELRDLYADQRSLPSDEHTWTEDALTDFDAFLRHADRISKHGKVRPRDNRGRFATTNTLRPDGPRLSKALRNADDSTSAVYTHADSGETFELILDADPGYDLLGVNQRIVRIGKTAGRATLTFHQGENHGTLHDFEISASNQGKGLLDAMIEFAENETGLPITALHARNAGQ
jgi:SPP1 gp7 family putative phage head morphogenesis protein